jgi:L-iditol 2-dehydrogenase
MRALMLTGPRRFEYGQMDIPAAAPEGWVRVRMRYAGICGSDIHYYTEGRIGDQIVKYPFVMGHEGSGEVIEGSGRLPQGAPVFIEPALVCHKCDQCLSGRANTCRNLRFLGNPLELAGCMRDEISLPPDCIVPLPDWMGLEEAVLLEPLSIGVHAVALSGARPGCRAGIVGSGPIGLVVLLALSDLQPAFVVVSEPVAARRAAAEALGAHATLDPGSDGAWSRVMDLTTGAGMDVVFECAGTQESIDDAARMLGPGGVLAEIGIPEVDRISYDPHLLRRREASVVHVRRQNNATHRALDLLGRRRDAASVLITHRFEPSRANEAFDLVHRKADKAIKVLMDLQAR